MVDYKEMSSGARYSKIITSFSISCNYNLHAFFSLCFSLVMNSTFHLISETSLIKIKFLIVTFLCWKKNKKLITY